MNSDRVTKLVAVTVLVVATIGAGLVVPVVQRQRRELDLVVEIEGSQGMPPHVAIVTAALGTFRGLAVDILWARADNLQLKGEFFEAQTLAQWITTLQPRFQKVWAFQAWNLAWNIPVATQVPAERWGWVNRGLDLLRSNGIPLNPRAANLYFEMAWIYQNKIGRPGDQQHWYYKARLAEEMQEFLGDLTGGRTTAQAIERFAKIVDAPATIAELLVRTPAAHRALDLLAAHGAPADENTMRMLGRALMFANSPDARLLATDRLAPGTNVSLLRAIRDDRETAALLFDHVVPHLQRRILEDRYRMRPTAMRAVMEKYGPLDWRHPDAHAIYWSEEGLDVSRQLVRREDVNELMYLRGRLQQLIELMRSGRVDYDAASGRIDLLPDPRFARAYERAVAEAFEMVESGQGVSAAEFGPAETEDLLDGYEKFLNLATALAFLYGDETEAARYFQLLRGLAERRGSGDEPLYADTVENFVAMRFAGIVQVNLADLRQFLDAMIRRAISEGLAKGDLRVFNRYVRLAYSVYDRRYAASRPDEKYVLAESRLLPFPKIVENSFANVMRQAGEPVLVKARIWSWAPETLRRATHEDLAATLRAEAEAAGLDPDRAFPAPTDREGDEPAKDPAPAAAGGGP